jgi:hypothetical protein
MAKKFSLGKWQDYRMLRESPGQLHEWSQIEASLKDLEGILTDSDQMFKLRQSLANLNDENKKKLIIQSITFLVGELKKLI